MIGIDEIIQTQQNRFTSNLWTGVGGLKYSSHHRAFINEREGLRIPEIQVSGKVHYLDTLLDTFVHALSFFVVDEERVALDNVDFETTVWIYFAVNLDVLYSAISERAEEYLIRDVTTDLAYTQFRLNSVKTGLNSFQDDFDFVKESDNMEPFFLARFETKVIFNVNNC